MEDNDNIGERLKSFLERKNLNVRQASQMLGHEKPSKLYKLVNNDAKPGCDTLIELVNQWPDLSLDWLVMGHDKPTPYADSDIAGLPAAARPVVPTRGMDTGRILAVTVDRMGKENIVHVPARVQAGYTRSFDEPAYLQDLTPYTLPFFSNGTLRSFEVEGNSMEPTFRTRDVVVCQYVDRLDLLQPGHCFVVVLSGNVVVKRLHEAITHRRQMVTLYSANPAYRPTQVPAEDILQLWQVRGYISTNVPASLGDAQLRLLRQIDVLGLDPDEVARFLVDQAPNSAPS
jgi:SOS-response transcriptional repressor LexA